MIVKEPAGSLDNSKDPGDTNEGKQLFKFPHTKQLSMKSPAFGTDAKPETLKRKNSMFLHNLLLIPELTLLDDTHTQVNDTPVNLQNNKTPGITVNSKLFR